MDVRLLILTGPGGVGKTRLAIAVARNDGETLSPMGSVFVDLTPLTELDLVLPTIAGVLGLHEVAGY